MLTIEAYIRCNGRCSRAMVRLIEDLARWLDLPWWLAIAILCGLLLALVAMYAYIGRRRPRRKPGTRLRARRRQW